MMGIWKMVHSLFTGEVPHRVTPASRVPVVALMVSELDRHVLSGAFGQEPLALCFVESFEEACSLASQLTAPIILLDRDWPETEWRAAVQRLAASPHQPCVILVSGVSDDYLSQELARWRGYDVLPKPLQMDKVEHTLKLALSYWDSIQKPAVAAGRPRK